MIKCEICGFEARNGNGLRLHSKKHRNENNVARMIVPSTDGNRNENLDSSEKTKIPKKKTIADVGKNVACVIVPSTGEIILRYSLKLNGENFIDLAIGMAKKKGLEVRFETE